MLDVLVSNSGHVDRNAWWQSPSRAVMPARSKLIADGTFQDDINIYRSRPTSVIDTIRSSRPALRVHVRTTLSQFSLPFETSDSK